MEKLVSEGRLARIVVDECHTLLEWGWRESLGALGKVLRGVIGTAPGCPPILAVSGTESTVGAKLISESLYMIDTVYVRAPLDRPELIYSVVDISNEHGDHASILSSAVKAFLPFVKVETASYGRTVVFVATTKDADVVAELPKSAYNAGAIVLLIDSGALMRCGGVRPRLSPA
jgi:superfamily II DNA helicase RecQ